MKLEQRFYILKNADVNAALSDIDRGTLYHLAHKVCLYRLAQGKNPWPKYVVINQDEPYFPSVLKLMEAYYDHDTDQDASPGEDKREKD